MFTNVDMIIVVAFNIQCPQKICEHTPIIEDNLMCMSRIHVGLKKYLDEANKKINCIYGIEGLL